MTEVMIVAGAPGSGKTTLARALAERSLQGVHLRTDEFYHFLAHAVDPSTPAAHDQNAAVMRAFLHAARSFAADGYAVYLDGVIGPWWLDTIRSILPDYGYVLLHSSLATAQQRCRRRSGQPSASPAAVATMHAQFDAVSGFDERWIDTTGRSPEAVLEVYLERYHSGVLGRVNA